MLRTALVAASLLIAAPLLAQTAPSPAPSPAPAPSPTLAHSTHLRPSQPQPGGTARAPTPQTPH